MLILYHRVLCVQGFIFVPEYNEIPDIIRSATNSGKTDVEGKTVYVFAYFIQISSIYRIRPKTVSSRISGRSLTEVFPLL